MKKTNVIISLICAMFFLSCTDDSIDMGTVYYSPSFLWVDADTIPLKKTFHFEFSDDAKSQGNIFAEFEFVDNNGVPISTDEMMIIIDGKEQPNNRFRVNCNEDSKEISYIFTPSASEGKHQGYLRLVKHNLHRIDNQELSDGQQADLFQWTLYYDKKMNPLAEALKWVAILVFAFVLAWILRLRRCFFPTFNNINKNVFIPNQAPINIRFKGKRMVVLDNVMHKQGWWDKTLRGEILYKQNAAITSPITLKPTSKGKKVLFVANPANYLCSPNPIDNQQPSKVTDVINHQNITIQ